MKAAILLFWVLSGNLAHAWWDETISFHNGKFLYRSTDSVRLIDVNHKRIQLLTDARQHPAITKDPASGEVLIHLQDPSKSQLLLMNAQGAVADSLRLNRKYDLVNKFGSRFYGVYYKPQQNLYALDVMNHEGHVQQSYLMKYMEGSFNSSVSKQGDFLLLSESDAYILNPENGSLRHLDWQWGEADWIEWNQDRWLIGVEGVVYSLSPAGDLIEGGRPFCQTKMKVLQAAGNRWIISCLQEKKVVVTDHDLNTLATIALSSPPQMVFVGEEGDGFFVQVKTGLNQYSLDGVEMGQVPFAENVVLAKWGKDQYILRGHLELEIGDLSGKANMRFPLYNGNQELLRRPDGKLLVTSWDGFYLLSEQGDTLWYKNYGRMISAKFNDDNSFLALDIDYNAYKFSAEGELLKKLENVVMHGFPEMSRGFLVGVSGSSPKIEFYNRDLEPTGTTCPLPLEEKGGATRMVPFAEDKFFVQTSERAGEGKFLRRGFALDTDCNILWTLKLGDEGVVGVLDQGSLLFASFHPRAYRIVTREGQTLITGIGNSIVIAPDQKSFLVQTSGLIQKFNSVGGLMASQTYDVEKMGGVRNIKFLADNISVSFADGTLLNYNNELVLMSEMRFSAPLIGAPMQVNNKQWFLFELRIHIYNEKQKLERIIETGTTPISPMVPGGV